MGLHPRRAPSVRGCRPIPIRRVSRVHAGRRTSQREPVRIRNHWRPYELVATGFTQARTDGTIHAHRHPFISRRQRRPAPGPSTFDGAATDARNRFRLQPDVSACAELGESTDRQRAPPATGRGQPWRVVLTRNVPNPSHDVPNGLYPDAAPLDSTRVPEPILESGRRGSTGSRERNTNRNSRPDRLGVAGTSRHGFRGIPRHAGWGPGVDLFPERAGPAQCGPSRGQPGGFAAPGDSSSRGQRPTVFPHDYPRNVRPRIQIAEPECPGRSHYR